MKYRKLNVKLITDKGYSELFTFDLFDSAVNQSAIHRAIVKQRKVGAKSVDITVNEVYVKNFTITNCGNDKTLLECIMTFIHYPEV